MVDIRKLNLSESDFHWRHALGLHPLTEVYDAGVKDVIEQRPRPFNFLEPDAQIQYNDDIRTINHYMRFRRLPDDVDAERGTEVVNRYINDKIPPDPEAGLTPEGRESFNKAKEYFYSNLEQKVAEREEEFERTAKEREARIQRELDVERDSRWYAAKDAPKFVNRYRFRIREKSRNMFQKMVSALKTFSSGEVHIPINKRIKEHYNEYFNYKGAKLLRKSRNSKYEFTDEENPDRPGFFRIRAKRDIPLYGVKKGDLGGFVDKHGSPDPLSSKGNCWVGGNAVLGCGSQISGNVLVDDNACVTGGCIIHDNAKILDNAVVKGECIISGSAIVGGNATVVLSVLEGNATAFGDSKISDSIMFDNAAAYENADISAGSCITGNGIVRGDASLSSSAVSDESIVEGRARVSEITVINGKSLVSGDYDIAGCTIESSKVAANLDGKSVSDTSIDPSNAGELEHISYTDLKIKPTRIREIGDYFFTGLEGRYTDSNMVDFIKKSRESLIENTPKSSSVVEQLKARGVSFPKPAEPDVEKEKEVSAPNNDSPSIDRPRDIDFSPAM